MCGFAGFLDFSGLARTVAEREQILLQSMRCLEPRGPDDQQLYDDGTLALGFRRLSIVDLEGGRQPIWNEDERVMGVVNGEVYNHLDLRARLEEKHRFRSRSDSEVMIHLYEDRGTGMLDEVNGMFGMAIWDTAKRRLVLARDRLGIKPLYYAVVRDTVIFGSELKALLAHPDCPRDMNWEEVRPQNSLHLPVTPSFVHGICHLPAGHMIVFEEDVESAPFAYWSIDDHFAGHDQEPKHSQQYYIDRYGELFDESVRLRLMSDVPVGIFLSGGIDSALVAAAAVAREQGLHCFTVAEETTKDTGDLGQAFRVAEQLGCPLHAVHFHAGTLLDELNFDLAYLEYMVWMMDSPRFLFEWFFKHELHRYSKTRVPDIKVMLLGQGADEFAGGYSNGYTRRKQNWGQYLHDYVGPAWQGFNDRQATANGGNSRRSDYQNMMYMNLYSLQFYNLWHEDRTSASQGIESRVPFLDHRIVELLASVPPAYHPSLFWDKKIVREQLRRLLPDYPLDWPKIPFIDIPGRTTVAELYKGVINRTINEFIEKYLGPGGIALPIDRVKALYRQTIPDSPAGRLATTRLLNILCAAIFEQLCLGRMAVESPPSIPALSPLGEIKTLESMGLPR